VSGSVTLAEVRDNYVLQVRKLLVGLVLVLVVPRIGELQSRCYQRNAHPPSSRLTGTDGAGVFLAGRAEALMAAIKAKKEVITKVFIM
jgi:hypothetical protein